MSLFNNIEAWLDHFQSGLITEAQLSYALWQHTNTTGNPGQADMITASTFCSVYGIKIPIVSYDPKHPGIPMWASCPHYLPLDGNPPHPQSCKLPVETFEKGFYGPKAMRLINKG